MTTTELNVPLSTTLASALVRVGLCLSLGEVEDLLSANYIRVDSLPLCPRHAEYLLSDFIGKTIMVGTSSLDVASEVPEPEIESEAAMLRRQFTALGQRLGSPISVDSDFDSGYESGIRAAADAIEELLSVPFGDTK